jgi:hypothetical protein
MHPNTVTTQTANGPSKVESKSVLSQRGDRMYSQIIRRRGRTPATLSLCLRGRTGQLTDEIWGGWLVEDFGHVMLNVFDQKASTKLQHTTTSPVLVQRSRMKVRQFHVSLSPHVISSVCLCGDNHAKTSLLSCNVVPRVRNEVPTPDFSRLPRKVFGQSVSKPHHAAPEPGRAHKIMSGNTINLHPNRNASPPCFWGSKVSDPRRTLHCDGKPGGLHTRSGKHLAAQPQCTGMLPRIKTVHGIALYANTS